MQVGKELVLYVIGGMSLIQLCTCAGAMSPAQIKAHAGKPMRTTANVPFVGCESDGQQGPIDAPKGKDKAAALTVEAAHRLAYYKAEHGSGVLAPRGWRCFGTYGSSGSSLFVSPSSVNADMVFSSTWKGFDGPVIQVSGEDGGTSGRFGVAETIARVFPAHRAFVRGVIKEGLLPASPFTYGPYPNDKLTYRSNEMVEFETPAQ